MKIYIACTISDGDQLIGKPMHAYTSLIDAQDSFGKGLAWTLTSYGRWENETRLRFTESYPHPVVIELDLHGHITLGSGRQIPL